MLIGSGSAEYRRGLHDPQGIKQEYAALDQPELAQNNTTIEMIRAVLAPKSPRFQG